MGDACSLLFWVAIFFTTPASAQDTTVKTIAQFSGPVTSLLFGDQPNQLLVAYQNRLAAVDLTSGKTTFEIEVPMAQVLDMQFSRDGERLFIAGGDPDRVGSLLILHWPSLEVVKRLDLHSDSITDLALSPDDSQIAVGSIDQTLTVLDLETEVPFRFEGHSKPMTGLLWLDAKTLVSCSEDTSLRVWDTATSKLTRTLNQHLDSVSGIVELTGAYEPNPVVASFGRDRTVRFWHPSTGRMIRFKQFDAQPRRLVWSASTLTTIVGNTAGQLHWLDWKTSKVLATKPVSNGWIESLAISPDGNSILVGDDAGKLLMTDVGLR
jgi:WD40 repeat protein